MPRFNSGRSSICDCDECLERHRERDRKQRHRLVRAKAITVEQEFFNRHKGGKR